MQKYKYLSLITILKWLLEYRVYYYTETTFSTRGGNLYWYLYQRRKPLLVSLPEEETSTGTQKMLISSTVLH